MSTPSVIKDALSSKKFIYVSVLFMLPITVFTAMGLMAIADWRHDALWAIGFLISGHTLESVAAQLAAPRAPGAPAVDKSTTTSSVTVNVPPAPATAPPEPPPPIRAGDGT